MNAEIDPPSTAEILSRQRADFLKLGPPSLRQRRADLTLLKRQLIASRPEIEAALNRDFGHRSRHETAIMELLTVVQGINHMHRHLAAWMRPARRQAAIHFQPARNYVLYQPLGVVGIVSPWNYPLALAVMPLATALAAGNRVLLKPSERTPATSALLAALLSRLFSPLQVAVVQGDAGVGAAFSQLPFDHLVFTGSTRVGRAVMAAAAENLVPVTLELGGKSPVVIDRGHAEAAAPGVAFGKLVNAGQTCIAPDYLMLCAQDVESFVEAYDRAVRRLYPQGTASPDYSDILDEHHNGRLLALLEDARSKGARIVEVGNSEACSASRPRMLRPALLLDVNDEMQIMREEIFGPLLPVRVYDGIEEAIDYINRRPRPLALYYFGPAGSNRSRLLQRTVSGNVTINNTLVHYAQDDLPFGGIGLSGMGAYHGVEGFRSLSHAKGVLEQSHRNLSNLLRPPFGALTELILRVMLK